MATQDAASSALMGTVCSISGHKGNKYEIKGHGVFIRPNLVLTCWHVLQGNKDLVFSNDAGETASMEFGSRFNRKMEEHDLATVKISRPLSSTPIKIAGNADHLLDRRGTLATRFNGRPGLYNVGVHEDVSARYIRESMDELLDKSVFGRLANAGLQGVYTELFNNATGGNNAAYITDKPMRPGYSGSPVFDSRGRLASLVSAIPAEHVEQGSRIFYGATPARLKGFIESVLG